MMQDKVSLALMLALAPGIGLLDFMWGRQLYDPVQGDAVKIMTMWFMTALITILVGALASVREIVKEGDIYRRERAVNLKLVPYLLSKVWVGVILAFYQAGVLLLTRILFNNPAVPGAGGYLQLYLTLFLCTLCGYLIGLVISASAPNQNSAMLLIIAVLVPQFLFAGALLPLDLIPGGEAISTVMPTRWAFESFLNTSGMGAQLIQDHCWQLPKSERKKLTDEQKTNCKSVGPWELLNNGEVGLKFEYSWSFSGLKQNATFNWDFIGIPGGNQAVVFDFIGVGKTTANLEEAYNFAKWMGFSPEGYAKRVEIAKAAGAVPNMPVAIDDASLAMYTEFFPDQPGIAAALGNLDSSLLESPQKVVPGFVNARWEGKTGIVIDGEEIQRIDWFWSYANFSKFKFEDYSAQLEEFANKVLADAKAEMAP